MTIRRHRVAILAVLSFTLVFFFSCSSSGPKPPAPGTPAFKWNVAQSAYQNGSFAKSADLLVELSKGDSEYARKARPWAMVMSLGLANSYLELAEKFNVGAMRNHSHPAPFHRVSSEYNTKAKSVAIQFVEVAHRFIGANQGQDVTLTFRPPEATFDDPVEYKKIVAGQLLPDAERAIVEKEVIQREILRCVCLALNTPEDPVKVKAAYQNDQAKVPSPQFLLATAKGLDRVGEVFGPKKLDQPNRLKIVYDEALGALALIKDNKEARKLEKKIKRTEKRMHL